MGFDSNMLSRHCGDAVIQMKEGNTGDAEDLEVVTQKDNLKSFVEGEWSSTFT